MYKATVSMIVCLITLMFVPLTSADYLIYNGSKTEKAYVVYAYYEYKSNTGGSGYTF